MKIAMIQISSQQDPEHNLSLIKGFLEQARSQHVEYVFLPEVFYSISASATPTPFLVREGNEHFQAIQSLARDYQMGLLGGSVAVEDSGAIKNRVYNFDKFGQVLNTYDKMNLFSCDLSNHPSKKVIREADVYTAGNKPCLLELNELWKMGVSVCFDLRFPELYRKYFHQGANLLSVASAFLQPTGRAHWHTLVRARAIENQSYVIAANQWGDNSGRFTSFGHSLVVDPWGEVLADLKEGNDMAIIDLDINKVTEVRQRYVVPFMGA
jgi:predicted amidohydrolase